MHLFRQLIDFPEKFQHGVVTIGNFDGVHLGHQALIAAVKKRAAELGVPSIVMTFEPQPGEYFGKSAIPRLTRWREKVDALAKLKVDVVIFLRFNAALASLSAAEFVERILCQRLQVSEVIVGDDFQFGKGREGSIALLQQSSAFVTQSLASVLCHSERISSTRIRQALGEGDHELAEQLLGRPYRMQGRVVHGDKWGRELGFPTANIHLHRKTTPIHGIYAVRVYGLDRSPLLGVANVGERPTVGGTRTLLEVHLFDFDENIYTRAVTVEFCKKLRNEERFDTLELLKTQMWQDAKAARHYFKMIEERHL